MRITSLLFLVLTLVNPLQVISQEAQDSDESRPDFVYTGKWPIGKSIGVVVLNDKVLAKDRTFKIYNADRSLWYQYSFYSAESANTTRTDFRPLTFLPEYDLLVLKCVGRQGENYEVVVNEETGATRFVKSNSRNLAFQSWRQHLLDSYAVDFEQSDNPLLTTPAGRKSSFRPTEDYVCRPQVIQGAWLKVRCTLEDPPKYSNAHTGWIKWRDEQKLTVDISYLP